jgi:hypothetical protein
MTTLDIATLEDVVGGLYKHPFAHGAPPTTIYNPTPRWLQLPGQPPVLINRPLPRPTPF